MKTLKQNRLIFPFFLLCLLVLPAFGQPTNKVIFKFKNQSYKHNDLYQQLIDESKAVLGEEMRPSQLFSQQKNEKNDEFGINRIYTFSINNIIQAKKWIQKMRISGLFEYVEFKAVAKVFFTPNDPSVTYQHYLQQIGAFQAWDVTNGDANVTIAIIDTGTEFNHPDLQGKEVENTADPVNGTDDDGNGFVDDFRGWDFYNNDNDPSFDLGDHGVNVASVAAAATNNSSGMASIGFNTKYLPVKAGQGQDITYGYEAIKYAADRGADIINCSWGTFDHTQFGLDMVNYATAKGSLIVAASGNRNKETNYYPAAYDNVLSVSSVKQNDSKAFFSNYGYYVDISAPGEDIYCAKSGGYFSTDGTSLSAPMVSGAAALIKAQFPTLKGWQLGAVLLQHVDPLYDGGVNSTHLNKLGKGRLQLANAVQQGAVGPLFRMKNFTVLDGNDNIFVSGDTLDITATYRNELLNATGVSVQITSTSSNVSFVNNSYAIGNLASEQEESNLTSPFEMIIEPSATTNEVVLLKITITDGTRTDSYYEEVIVNVDYLNIDVNNIALTISSKGMLGYNAPNAEQGIGLMYKGGNTLLYEAGFMMGAKLPTTPIVEDRIRNTSTTWDKDWSVVEAIHEVTPENEAAMQFEGIFTDVNTPGKPVGVNVHYKVQAWDETEKQNFVWMSYNVINVSSDTIRNMAGGMFTDWDLPDYQKNKGKVREESNLAYTYSTVNNGLFAGVQLLEDNPVYAYLFDNVSGGNGGISIFSSISNSQKYTAMTTKRLVAGEVSSVGNDVIQMISAKTSDLPPGDSVTYFFAYIIADSEQDLLKKADSSYYFFHGEMPNGLYEVGRYDNGKVYPNPFYDQVNVLTEKIVDQIQVRDLSGRLVKSTLGNGTNHLKLELSDLLKGMYLIEVSSDKKKIIYKILKSE